MALTADCWSVFAVLLAVHPRKAATKPLPSKSPASPKLRALQASPKSHVRHHKTAHHAAAEAHDTWRWPVGRIVKRYGFCWINHMQHILGTTLFRVSEIFWLVCGLVLAVLCCDPKSRGHNSQLNGGALWTPWHTSTLQEKTSKCPSGFTLMCHLCHFQQSKVAPHTIIHHKEGSTMAVWLQSWTWRQKMPKFWREGKQALWGHGCCNWGWLPFLKAGYDTRDLSSISAVSGWIHSGLASFKAVRCSWSRDEVDHHNQFSKVMSFPSHSWRRQN